VLVFSVGFMMRLLAQDPDAVRWESMAVRALGIGLGVYGFQLLRRERDRV
jgi:hypothetical protein